MAQVKVFNDNKYPYSENFRDQQIKIAPKGFIWMELDEAKMLLRTMAPVKLNADGRPTPEGYKMLRIEKTTEAKEQEKAQAEELAKTSALTCQICSYEGSSAADIKEHSTQSHAELIVKSEEAEREIAKRKRTKAS